MKHTLILLTALLLAPLAALHAAETSSVEKSDVIVYGSTPGWFCAAIAAAREGASVVLERKRGQDSLILHNYHEMTHHGEDSKLLEWLTKVDTWYSAEWAYFIEKLKSVKEGNETLLDHTLLAWSSSGGTLNAHNNTELPAMLFGGKALGVKHQGHLSQKTGSPSYEIHQSPFRRIKRYHEPSTRPRFPPQLPSWSWRCPLPPVARIARWNCACR